MSLNIIASRKTRASNWPPVSTGKQAGVALLEALIAILLFSVGILGMVALQARASQISVNSEDRALAAMLANEMVAEMWAQNSVTASTAGWQARIAASKLPSAQGLVTKDSCGNTEVTVVWTAINRAENASAAASTAASSASSGCTTGVVKPAGVNSVFTTKVVIPS
ncbi:type IV pilus modification protein PilV [Viridibacterium curvum]|uniref:Type IV pilus modification protein PilV n=1 Tax=Viridibacterium curvum TaxID=1101404 RepID=A0ABP9Q7T0_9RHOO